MASVQTSSYDGRYLKLTVVEESTSIDNNTSTVRWTLESLGGKSNYYNVYSVEVKINNSTVYGPTTKTWDSKVFPAAKGSTSGTVVINHNQDGTADPLPFSLRGSIFNNNPQTYSDTLTLSTIPRASQIGVPDANIGSSTNIAINKASDNFTTSLFYKATGQSEWTQIISKTNLQVYAWTVPTSFYSLIPNSKTIQCEFKAETYSEDTLIGFTTTTATFTATGDPIINSITKTDINATTTALTGDSNKMIKYASNVRINVSAVAQNSATINSITVNGTTAVNGVVDFNGAITNSFEIVVIDSRGNSITQTETMTMVDYIPLTINGSIDRNTPVDGKVNIDLIGNYFNDTFGSQNNSLIVQYRSIEKGDSWENVSWNNLTPAIRGNTYTVNTQLSNYDYTKQYEFQIRAIDEIQTKVIEGINVPKGKPIYNWAEDMFNVNGDIYQNETLLSNLYLALTGGTISGNLNVTGDLKKNGDNVALASSVPTKVSDLENDSQFTTLDQANGYSTTEMPIGKWYNDEIIYRKVIDFGSLPATSSAKYVDHNIVDLDEIIGIKAVGYNGSDTYYPIPFAGSPSMYNSTTLSIRVNATQIGIASSGTSFSGHTAIVILEYTKSS